MCCYCFFPLALCIYVTRARDFIHPKKAVCKFGSHFFRFTGPLTFSEAIRERKIFNHWTQHAKTSIKSKRCFAWCCKRIWCQKRAGIEKICLQSKEEIRLRCYSNCSVTDKEKVWKGKHRPHFLFYFSLKLLVNGIDLNSSNIKACVLESIMEHFTMVMHVILLSLSL